MKKLIFTACLLFTVTSISAGTVGEQDSDCAAMIQANRNGAAVAVESSVPAADSDSPEVVVPR